MNTAASLVPFRVSGPSMIQVSGGRSSARMLWGILRAHDGILPANVIACFQNTGREHPATYRFIERCAAEWGVQIRWIEWRPDAPGFEEVGPNSADRSGRWFELLISKRKFLPNSVARFCTAVLKVLAARNFARSLGWEEWTCQIGIRADEPERLAGGRARNASGKEAYDCEWPLAAAGITEPDVLDFWREQPFDLELPSKSFGNCQTCHLKHRAKLLEVGLADPAVMDWDVRQERIVTEMVASGETKMVDADDLFGGRLPAGEHAARFRRNGWTYAQMQEFIIRYPEAAQAEVDKYYRDLAAGNAQPDLLARCQCGAGA